MAEEKRKSGGRKLLKGIALTALSALAALAIYDHRGQIVSGTKKSASWIKTKATGVANVFKKDKKD